MRVIRNARQMQGWSLERRAEGKRIGFAPTMGFLHDGHLALIRAAGEKTDLVVASIFVNPMQFNDPNDLLKYPRDEAGDLAKCEAAGAEIVYCPPPEDVYPPDFLTSVDVERLTDGLCGAARPGHFKGVTTVVAKLFNIVLPHVAVFGEKDYQQLAVIRRMAADLNFPIEIVGHPTVREPDGLAMSSRNARLSPADRVQARALSLALFAARAAWRTGVRDAAELVAETRRGIEASGPCRIDYVEVVHADTLAPLAEAGPPCVMALAVHIGAVRLIDNIRLDSED